MLVVVLGCFRCGTSLVAGLLHHMGVDICSNEDLKTRDENNPMGYFERKEFSQHNIKILRAADGSTIKLPADIRIEELVDIFSGDTKKLIDGICHNEDGEYRTTEVFGWKEATNGLVLCHYLPYLADDTVFIKVNRNIKGIVDSAKRSWRWDEHFTLRLAYEYERRTSKYLQENCYVHEVSYEDLIQDPLHSIEKFANLFDLTVTDEINNKIKADFVLEKGE